MHGKNFAHEPFAKHTPVSNQSINTTGRRMSIPPIVCVVLPGGEFSLAAPLLRLMLGIPVAAYFFVESEPLVSGDHPGNTGVDLNAILQQNTIMPVIIAGQGTAVEANQVYLANCELSLQYSGDTLVFRSGASTSRGDGSVDHFLAMLAPVVPDRHVIVLPQHLCGHVSGGLRVVRAEGGFVLAFTEDDGLVFQRAGLMPADLVLTPAETAVKVQLLIDDIRKDKKLEVNESQEAELARIYLQLLRKRGMDFSWNIISPPPRCVFGYLAIAAGRKPMRWLSFSPNTCTSKKRN